jgi:hypothetical protein
MSGRTLLLVVAVVGSAVFPGGNAGGDAEHVDVVPRASDTVDASELDGAAAVNIGGTVGGTRVRDDPLPTGKNFIAFGSCNKQYLPQPAWDAILRKAPDLFLFTGDAVYTNANHPDQVEAIHEALAMQSARTEYRDFVARIPVDGECEGTLAMLRLRHAALALVLPPLLPFSASQWMLTRCVVRCGSTFGTLNMDSPFSIHFELSGAVHGATGFLPPSPSSCPS